MALTDDLMMQYFMNAMSSASPIGSPSFSTQAGPSHPAQWPPPPPVGPSTEDLLTDYVNSLRDVSPGAGGGMTQPLKVSEGGEKRQYSDLESEAFRNAAQRYQGATSDPDTGEVTPRFAVETPNLSSKFFDQAGNLQSMAPNPQAPQNQPQPEMLSGMQRIRSLAQLAPLLKMLQGAPDELKTKILSSATGIPLDTPKAQALQNTLLQLQAKRAMEAPDRAERTRERQQQLDISRQHLEDMRTYRMGLLDQGTKFSDMMRHQHIIELQNMIKNMSPADPTYPGYVKELQDSMKDAAGRMKELQANPQAATRGGQAAKGAFNVGGKPVTWERVDEGQ